MTTNNKFEQLRQAVGGFKKSDTLGRFKQDLAHRDLRKKSQLVALKILRAIRRQNLSQKQFAERLNVTPQQVNKWVKGSENFTFETIEKIEKALGIILIDVVEDKSQMISSKSITIMRIYTKPRNTLRAVIGNTKQRIKTDRPYSQTRQYA